MNTKKVTFKFCIQDCGIIQFTSVGTIQQDLFAVELSKVSSLPELLQFLSSLALTSLYCSATQADDYVTF